MDPGEKANPVMVVEDDPLIRRLITDILDLNHFRSVSCPDGSSALETLRRVTPSLILLDIGMPGMDGFEVFKRIKADGRFGQVKIVAISASTMKEEEARIHAAGFDGFIAKPLDIKNFVKLIKECIR